MSIFLSLPKEFRFLFDKSIDEANPVELFDYVYDHITDNELKPEQVFCMMDHLFGNWNYSVYSLADDEYYEEHRDKIKYVMDRTREIIYSVDVKKYYKGVKTEKDLDSPTIITHMQNFHLYDYYVNLYEKDYYTCEIILPKILNDTLGNIKYAMSRDKSEFERMWVEEKALAFPSVEWYTNSTPLEEPLASLLHKHPDFLTVEAYIQYYKAISSKEVESLATSKNLYKTILDETKDNLSNLLDRRLDEVEDLIEDYKKKIKNLKLEEDSIERFKNYYKLESSGDESLYFMESDEE